MGGSHEEHLSYFKKREEQLQACPKGSYAVVLKADGLVHGSFSDSPLLEAHGRPAETAIALHNQALIQSFIQAFLDKTLKNEQERLFDEHTGHSPRQRCRPWATNAAGVVIVASRSIRRRSVFW